MYTVYSLDKTSSSTKVQPGWHHWPELRLVAEEFELLSAHQMQWPAAVPRCQFNGKQ